MTAVAGVSAFDLERSYVHLTDGPEAMRSEVTPDCWATIDPWHCARVLEPSEIWFVTYGEGTQHRGV